MFTAEMLSHAAPSLHEFDALASEPFVAFLEPPSLDDRIINQFALFSLAVESRCAARPLAGGATARVPQAGDPGGPEVGNPRQARPSQHHERVLYPGLDGLSRWLTRYYTPNPRDNACRATESTQQERLEQEREGGTKRAAAELTRPRRARRPKRRR